MCLPYLKCSYLLPETHFFIWPKIHIYYKLCFLTDVLWYFQVHVLNTHLSLSHEAREQSVIQIWQYVKQLEGPVIFLGDLNAEPQERAVQYVYLGDITKIVNVDYGFYL